MDCRATDTPHSIPPDQRLRGCDADLLFRHEGRRSDARQNGPGIASAGGAIEHSKELARRVRRDPRITDRSLSIVVIDESGEAVHREPVHPDTFPKPPKFQRSAR
jgi:hypothetical protein